MADSTGDQLKALWARLNANPDAAAARKKTDPDWLIIQWEQPGLQIIEATVGTTVTRMPIVELPGGGASNPEVSVAWAASLLRDRLAAQKISTKQTAVIV